MKTEREKLREARRMINDITRILRQTNAYFEGISALDEAKLKRKLKEAIHNSDRFLAAD